MNTKYLVVLNEEQRQGHRCPRQHICPVGSTFTSERRGNIDHLWHQVKASMLIVPLGSDWQYFSR